MSVEGLQKVWRAVPATSEGSIPVKTVKAALTQEMLVLPASTQAIATPFSSVSEGVILSDLGLDQILATLISYSLIMHKFGSSRYNPSIPRSHCWLFPVEE